MFNSVMKTSPGVWPGRLRRQSCMCYFIYILEQEVRDAFMHVSMREHMHESIHISTGAHVFGLEMQLIELVEAVGRTKKEP